MLFIVDLWNILWLQFPTYTTASSPPRTQTLLAYIHSLRFCIGNLFIPKLHYWGEIYFTVSYNTSVTFFFPGNIPLTAFLMLESGICTVAIWNRFVSLLCWIPCFFLTWFSSSFQSGTHTQVASWEKGVWETFFFWDLPVWEDFYFSPHMWLIFSLNVEF